MISPADNSRMPRRCLRSNVIQSGLLISSPDLRSGISPVRLVDSAGQKKAAARAASNRFCRDRWSLDDSHSFFAVEILEHHLDDFALLRRHQLADVVSLDRQLAMFLAAIDQYRQLYPARPAEIDQLVQRGADGPSGVKHIIDQDDVSAF